MNADEIRGVTFDRTMRGYRPEEVDEFLARVAAEMDKLQEEKEDAEQKMFILAEKVDQYRDDEETLKTALLNAQRMGESVIHEARQKAETIIYDANSKASRRSRRILCRHSRPPRRRSSGLTHSAVGWKRNTFRKMTPLPASVVPSSIWRPCARVWTRPALSGTRP